MLRAFNADDAEPQVRFRFENGKKLPPREALSGQEQSAG
jgi:hypothetical protein